MGGDATLKELMDQAAREQEQMKDDRARFPPSERAAFTIKDSGARAQFTGGMVRDTEVGKRNYTLIRNGPMFERWAEHLTKGEIKYPPPTPGGANWMLAEGIEELVRFRKSAARHFEQWLNGETDEDHAAAVYFNINGAEYVKAKMEGR